VIIIIVLHLFVTMMLRGHLFLAVTDVMLIKKTAFYNQHSIMMQCVIYFCRLINIVNTYNDCYLSHCSSIA